MARINIDDSLFKDTRFFELAIKLGSKTTALGAVIEAFIVAQEFFLNKETHQLIPFEEWEKQKLHNALIEVGLAKKITNKGVYVSGANKQFSWLLQRVEAGRKGGKNKAKNTQKHGLAGASGSLAKASKRKPLTLTPTLSLSLNNNLNTIAQNKFELERFYELYPRKIGKKRGLAKLKTIVKDQETYDMVKLAIENYGKYCSNQKLEARYIKHFSTFVNSWEDWIELPTEKAVGEINWSKVFEK